MPEFTVVADLLITGILAVIGIVCLLTVVLFSIDFCKIKNKGLADYAAGISIAIIMVYIAIGSFILLFYKITSDYHFF